MPTRVAIIVMWILLLGGRSALGVGGTLFQIGNSLTWDSRPSSTATTSAAWGSALTIGYQVRSGSTLSEVYSLPPDRISEFGPFNDALPNLAWDNVMLQLHKSGGETMATDLSALESFISLTRSNPANASTDFYLYGSWPWKYEFNKWDNIIPNELTTPTINAKMYYHHVAERVSDLFDEQVHIVPVGEVLKRVDEEAKAGRIPGLTSVNDVYNDHIHMNEMGSYLASTTVLATILKQDPRSMPFLSSEWPYPSLTPSRVAIFQKIVWDVVANNPYTGVVAPRLGDVNGDGDVDHLDLEIWQSDLLNQPVLRADANGDLRVDQLDLDFWETALHPTPIEIATNFNNDLNVDALDYGIWTSNFGATGQISGDANDDGSVSAADFVLWRDAVEIGETRHRADFDGDGDIDLFDRDVWEEQNGLFWELRADFSGNNILDYDDVLVWQEEFFDFSARLVGDYDQNGIVNLNDRTVWEQTNGSRFLLNADGNNDGFVNQADYDVWLSFYNPEGGGAAVVPEPAGIILGTIAAFILAAARRRSVAR